MFLSLYLPIYLSTYLPTYLLIYFSIHLSIYLSIYLPIYLSIITTLLRGGPAQIARHSVHVFQGGGPGKCQQTFFFLANYVLFAKNHFSRPPHSLRDLIIFLKRRGA